MRLGAEAEAARLLGRVLALYAAGAAALVMLARQGFPALSPLAAILLGLAGLSGATVMALARSRAAAAEGAAALIGRAARRPQGALVPGFALGAIGCAWLAWTMPAASVSVTHANWLLAASGVAAFMLLLAERYVRAMNAAALPEAAALSRLLRVPVVVIAIHGLSVAAHSGGLPWAHMVDAALAFGVAAVAAELAVRGLARWFLPPPEPEAARAAVDSVLLRAAAQPVQGGLAAPLRDHFGMDFSRSWALSYARTAFAPLVLVLLLGAWLLSGVVLVPADRRAVAERFGEPVAVLKPGLHAVLPWPLGRALPVEFGTVHETALAGVDLAAEKVAAEGPAPASADRLWEAAHPAELMFLVASESGGQQSFQIVSADIRVLYRVGPTDEDAIRSVTSTADPAALVRTACARAVAAALARRTLPQILGPERDTLAGELRLAARHELDRLGSGLDIVAVSVEAIHPPPGAADAYHNVQAAEIIANTTMSTERGRAQAEGAMARMKSATQLNAATAAGEEHRLVATTEEVRFAADRQAAQAGGRAFLMERTNESLIAALAATPKTVLDRRLGGGEATVIDLRPLLPGGSPAAKED